MEESSTKLTLNSVLVTPQQPGDCRLKGGYNKTRDPQNGARYPLDSNLHGGYRHVHPGPGKCNKYPCNSRKKYWVVVCYL